MLGDFVKDIRMAMRKLDGARRLKIGMVAIAVLLCSSFFLPASPLQEQALYFLSGTFNGGGQWPVRLYKVDAAQEIVTFIREVAPSSETVIADYDHGVLVIASPPNAPNTLDTVFMDSPSKLSRESLSYDAKKFLPESIFELNIAMKGPVVALALGQMWRQIDPQPATRLLAARGATQLLVWCKNTNRFTMETCPWASEDRMRNRSRSGSKRLTWQLPPAILSMSV
jgi:hypothetical protein